MQLQSVTASFVLQNAGAVAVSCSYRPSTTILPCRGPIRALCKPVNGPASLASCALAAPYSKNLHFSSNQTWSLLPNRLQKTKQQPHSSPGLKQHKGAIRASLPEAVKTITAPVLVAFQQQPATWASALVVNLAIFAIGSPVLLSGLTLSGVAAAFVLGTATWRAFGAAGYWIVALYFVLGTAVTKVRLKEKQAEGIAEKRSGRRGPGSVIGSGTAGFLCALAASLPLPGVATTAAAKALLRLGFVASFCTKLSDTGASEIGKAFGRTTYLVTTFQPVSRGTEGAVSLEGTMAGLLAAMLLAGIATALGIVDGPGAAACVVASQVANYGESVVGATLQDQPGYEWLTNDFVNVLNIGVGAMVAMILRAMVRT